MLTTQSQVFLEAFPMCRQEESSGCSCQQAVVRQDKQHNTATEIPGWVEVNLIGLMG